MLAYSGQLPRDWFACSWRASSVSEARLTVSKNWLDGAGLPCVPPSGLRFKAVFELSPSLDRAGEELGVTLSKVTLLSADTA